MSQPALRLLLTFFIQALAALAVAYTNGANANFKGVATLYGSGRVSYRQAVRWAAITTFAGCLTATYLATSLLKSFSGKGLVPDTIAQQPAFLTAVAGGSGIAGFFATRLGFPVSTTHLIIGALIGAGTVAEKVNLSLLWSTFLLPLLFSPILAITVSFLLFGIWHSMQRSKKPRHLTSLSATTSSRIKSRLDALHFLSAGAVCFARGLNDAPKIAALLGTGSILQGHSGILSVAVAMALGGFWSAKPVAETLSYKITSMNAEEGFAANLATALLVTTASIHGLPVSTTHVSVGSLLGVGILTHQAKWGTALPVLAAWVLTLPFSALLTALLYSTLLK